MPAVVASIFRFPVKGLRGEPLEAVHVPAGGGVPDDRRFAIARGDARGDPAEPKWLPKQRCVMLMRDAELARLSCRVDFAAGTIALATSDGPACEAPFTTPDGRTRLEGFLNTFLGARSEGPVRLLEARRLSFTDVPENCLSLINLASVRALAERMGHPVHPLRFRANVYVDGLPAWAEFDWVGGRVTAGDVGLRIHARIRRCAATGVDPEQGTRDLNVLKALKSHFGHVDMGVYAEVERGGRLAVGDRLVPPERARARSALGHRLRFFRFLARSAGALLRRQ